MPPTPADASHEQSATLGVARPAASARSEGGSAAASAVGGRLVALQRASGNHAVAALVASRLKVPGTEAVVQRDDEKKTFGEVLEGDDPDALKPFRPFPPLSVPQLRKICRLVIDKNRWVGPDDEVTIESAWRAVAGDRSHLEESDWALWKECDNYGAEMALIPWMRDLRTTFADRVRESATTSVDKNSAAITAEAKRLGIAVDGSPVQPSAQADEAVAQQRGVAMQIRDANAKLKQLRTIPVGYGPPSWGTAGGGKAPALPPGGTPDIEPKKIATFDPDKPPLERSDPDPNPGAGIGKYEAVKAVHESITTAVGELLNANPALYAMAARGGTDAALEGSTDAVRAKMSEALLDVMRNATKTRSDIQDRSLSFSEMQPVHRTVLAGDPQFRDGFSKKVAADYVTEEGGAEAAASKLVSLLTIALITTVEVASGGTATPVVGALISLAASAGTTAASWNDWSKLEAAAKSTVSDKNAIVTQDQADAAQLGALISTAAALLDVYGVGKAVKAASTASKAAVSALEGRVSDAAALRKVAQGAAVADARAVVTRSVDSIGPAATAKAFGNWQKLVGTAEPGAVAKLTGWRTGVFQAAEASAVKAAAGQEGSAARAALAIASGIEQAAMGEALDAVIEIIGGGGSEEMGYVGFGGKAADFSAAINAQVESMAPASPVQKSLQRSMVEIVEVPFSELKLASMSPAEFERIIRQGSASGYFSQQGLPRMTVIDAKLHGGGHGYDGLGIAKQGDLIQLYNLECKHIAGDSNHVPSLSATDFGTQGGLRWNESKARSLLHADNPFAEETRAMLTKALKQRVGAFDERILEDTLAGALRRSHFYAFAPVWAKTEHLLAQMRGLASSGLSVGKLIRVKPRGW
ncbi:hypothetical protein WDJ51_12000 [Rathayibacter sp. YIM 133350]|uniref:hypothetical protein n=1 Tax=Rathayibacter sp. YIM 133350 TaxID=3131992 RepID=UPI00307E45BD